MSLAKTAERPHDLRLTALAAASAAADRHDPEAVLEAVAALLDLPTAGDERTEDHAFAVAALRLAGDPESAWAVGRRGLAELGLRLPEAIGRRDLLLPMARWRLSQWLSRPSGSQRPPSRLDPLTRLCDATATLAFEHSALLAAWLALEGRRRAPPRSRGAAFWLGCDVFLNAVIGDFAGAARLGERTVEAIARSAQPRVSAAATLYRAVFWGLVWRRSQAELRPRCLEVRDLALAEGDRAMAAIAVRNWAVIGWRTAPLLDDLQGEIGEAQGQLTDLGDQDSQAMVGALAAAVSALRGRFSAMPAWARAVPPGNSLLVMELANLRGDHAAALAAAEREPLLRRQLANHPRGADWRFHDAVARMKTGRRPARRDLAYLRKVARLNPIDNAAKRAILEALRRPFSLANWARALDAADRGPSRLEAGLCASLAGEAVRAAGYERLAALFADRAQAVWRDWGATALLRPNARNEGGELRAASRRRLAEAAHELRTPLQALRASLDLADHNSGALDISSLRQGIVTLASLVDDLGLDRSTAGDGRRGAVDLPRLIECECSALRPLAARAGRSLEWASNLLAPRVIETDGADVAQVLRNLVSNAVKYGGPRILVRLAIDGSAVEISVEDDGPGVVQADLDRIFASGERGAHAGEFGGEGLGLFISRRIAERLGGALTLQPRHPRGVRFTLTLPHASGAGGGEADGAGKPP